MKPPRLRDSQLSNHDVTCVLHCSLGGMVKNNGGLKPWIMGVGGGRGKAGSSSSKRAGIGRKMQIKLLIFDIILSKTRTQNDYRQAISIFNWHRVLSINIDYRFIDWLLMNKNMLPHNHEKRGEERFKSVFPSPTLRFPPIHDIFSLFVKKTPGYSSESLIRNYNLLYTTAAQISIPWTREDYVLIDWVGGPDGKIFGLRSGRTDRAQRGPYLLTESQIFSRPARPYSVHKHFIIWPLAVENFENSVWT